MGDEYKSMVRVEEPANEATPVSSTAPRETGLNGSDTNINQREGISRLFEAEEAALLGGGEATPTRPLLIAETRRRGKEHASGFHPEALKLILGKRDEEKLDRLMEPRIMRT